LAFAGLLAAATSTVHPQKPQLSDRQTPPERTVTLDNATIGKHGPQLFPISGGVAVRAKLNVDLAEMFWTISCGLTNGRSPRLMSERTATPGWRFTATGGA
jgi:hypothetical protein